MAGTPSEAPRSNEARSGSGVACRSGTTLHSAAVPHREPAAASHSQTRSPARRGSRLGFAAYVNGDVGVRGGVEEFGRGFKDQFAVVLGRQWLRADEKLSERESKHRIEQLFPPRRLHEPY